MKRLLLIIPVFILLIMSSCANIQSIDDSVFFNKRVVKNESASELAIIGTKQTPPLVIIPEKTQQINSIAQYKKHFYIGKAVVLTYHHISDKPFSGITIKPERFESDLKLLKDNNFNIISMKKLINCIQGIDILPENAVVITFDDGIESFYKYAYPLLKEYNFPATNFIITSRTEAYSPSKEDFNPLSPEEVNEMYDSGLVDIESHSDNGHDYVVINDKLEKAGKLAYRIYNPKTKTYESEDAYNKRILDDLEKSSERIFKYTGSYPQMLCFPFGHYNKRLIELSKQSGFKYFITTQYGYNKQNSHSNIVLRIRAGDSNLSSDKLLVNIVYCANNIKITKEKKTKIKTSNITYQNNSTNNLTVTPSMLAPTNEEIKK